MSYQEKRAAMSMISTLVIFALYCLFVFKRLESGRWDMEDPFRFWGTVFLLLIPVQVVSKIVIHILFAIVNKIATNDDPPEITDEMDKLIEMRARNYSYYVFSAGFVLSMAAVLGWGPTAVFGTIMVSWIVASVAEEITQIFLYRRGF